MLWHHFVMMHYIALTTFTRRVQWASISPGLDWTSCPPRTRWVSSAPCCRKTRGCTWRTNQDRWRPQRRELLAPIRIPASKSAYRVFLWCTFWPAVCPQCGRWITLINFSPDSLWTWSLSPLFLKLSAAPLHPVSMVTWETSPRRRGWCGQVRP